MSLRITPSLRRTIGTAAALVLLLLAQAARAEAVDGGAAPAPVMDAGASPEVAPPPAELSKPPELPAVTATSVATAMLAQPAPVEEPPRPITKRLWFWMAVTAVVVGAVLIGIAVNNPSHTRPECPPDYVCL